MSNCAVGESKCLGKADVAAVPPYVDVLVVIGSGCDADSVHIGYIYVAK